MHRLRFRLRTLLIATAILGGGLGWWFRPFTLKEHWPNGQLKSQLHVRRGLTGRLITHGQQHWWWSNGQLARAGISYGDAIAHPSVTMPLKEATAFGADGLPWDIDSEIDAALLALLWSGFAAETTDDSGQLKPAEASFPETEHDYP